MMILRSLLQDILSEVSSKIIGFQMELHLLITLVRSSDYFRFIESLRTCIMASQSTGNLKLKLHVCTLGLRSSKSFLSQMLKFLFQMLYAWVCSICVMHEFRSEMYHT